MSSLQLIEIMNQKVNANPKARVIRFTKEERKILEEAFLQDEFHNALYFHQAIFNKTRWGDSFLLPNEMSAITHWLQMPKNQALRKKLEEMFCDECRGHGFVEEICTTCHGEGWKP